MRVKQKNICFFITKIKTENLPVVTAGTHISRQLNPELAWKMTNCNLSEFQVAADGYNNLSGMPDEMFMRQLNQTTFGDFEQNRFA